MLTQANQSIKDLYDTDYHLWVMETVKLLENKAFDSLDLENLIEEVADLSRRDKQKLKSLLKRLVEHLLKLKYWQSQAERNAAYWKREILNFRQKIQEELADSPSLKPYLRQMYAQCYENGRKLAATASSLPLEHV
jgi:type I site-specific restriction-modification system R (restriction) subunit